MACLCFPSAISLISDLTTTEYSRIIKGAAFDDSDAAPFGYKPFPLGESITMDDYGKTDLQLHHFLALPDIDSFGESFHRFAGHAAVDGVDVAVLFSGRDFR